MSVRALPMQIHQTQLNDALQPTSRSKFSAHNFRQTEKTPYRTFQSSLPAYIAPTINYFILIKPAIHNLLRTRADLGGRLHKRGRLREKVADVSCIGAVGCKSKWRIQAANLFKVPFFADTIRPRCPGLIAVLLSNTF